MSTGQRLRLKRVQSKGFGMYARGMFGRVGGSGRLKYSALVRYYTDGSDSVE